MKKHLLKLILAVFAVLFALMFWHGRKQNAIISGEASESAPRVLTNRPANEATTASSNITHIETTDFLSTNSHSVDQSDGDKLPEIYQAYNEKHNVPVRFYGLVVDQDDNFLTGAKIDVVVRQTYMTKPTALVFNSKTSHFQRITDAAGRFDIQDEKGDGLVIDSIQKNGYEPEPFMQTYGTSSGTFENPMVFKMWSTNIHEQLIIGEKKQQIVPDGRLYFIDLANGTISESGEGDLKIWIQYTNQPIHGQLSDWSAGIEVINGGLLEERIGTAMYQAPTDGYVPSFQLQGQIKGGQRGDIGDRQFYLRLKNGQEYGQISINLIAPFNNQTSGLVRLSYAINPSGSRILR